MQMKKGSEVYTFAVSFWTPFIDKIKVTSSKGTKWLSMNDVSVLRVCLANQGFRFVKERK